MDKQLNFAPCGYVSITNTGIIQEANQTFLDMLECSLHDLTGKHIESLLTMANKFLFHTYFYPYIQLNGRVEELYLTLKTNKGKEIPVLLNGISNKRNGMDMIDCVFVHMKKRIDYEKEIRQVKKQIEDAYQVKDEALKKLELLHMEVEEKQKELLLLNDKLLDMANTDILTGLYNRRFFLEELEKIQTAYSLFIIDVDHFKHVNDTLGHIKGDQVLIELARLLESLCDEKNIAARYGGEEFIILLPETNEAASKENAEMIRHRIETHTWAEVPITVSIGAASFTDADDSTLILSKADQALYTSKNNGRNQVTHFDDIKRP